MAHVFCVDQEAACFPSLTVAPPIRFCGLRTMLKGCVLELLWSSAAVAFGCLFSRLLISKESCILVVPGTSAPYQSLPLSYRREPGRCVSEGPQLQWVCVVALLLDTFRITFCLKACHVAMYLCVMPLLWLGGWLCLQPEHLPNLAVVWVNVSASIFTKQMGDTAGRSAAIQVVVTAVSGFLCISCYRVCDQWGELQSKALLSFI